MMDHWRQQLKHDPVPLLLSSGDDALVLYTRRDLLEEEAGPESRLWQLSGAQRIVRKQNDDGSWTGTSGKKHEAVNYGLIETWRQLRVLVDTYGFTRENPSAAKAAEFVFSCQTEEGDFRGFLANQYATYYTGALLSLLVKAGYHDDPRARKAFEWLLSVRQDDGGWTVPILTRGFDGKTMYRLTSTHSEPVQPERSKPFSHNWTGMVLRAFAAHPDYRESEAALKAARLLKSRFFEPDCYSSYQSPHYWVRFEYPFWWNNLVAALDSISFIDPGRDEQVDAAVHWLIDHQREDTLWDISYAMGKHTGYAGRRERRLWVALAICRVLKRIGCSPPASPSVKSETCR